jgi:hypothetical protein
MRPHQNPHQGTPNEVFATIVAQAQACCASARHRLVSIQSEYDAKRGTERSREGCALGRGKLLLQVVTALN